MAKENPKESKGKNSKNNNNNHYTAEDIYVLEGLEPVRKRPGMYIGSTGVDGLHHLVWEIFDNSRDEAMGGFANEIEVALLPGDRVRVSDNGRGIPVDIHKKTKVSALETVMTTLHAGGKFGGESYKIAGGLHGVGASVVNALSVWLKAEVHTGGGKHVQEYKRGAPLAKVKKIDSTKFNGTVIIFEPDPEIFPEIKFNYQTILSHLRQQAYLVKSLRIRVMDLRGYDGKIDDSALLFLDFLKLPGECFTFYFDGGLMSLVRHMNKSEKPIHDKIFYVEKETEGIIVECALQYIEGIDTKEISFANNIKTPDGGAHLTGFRTALTRVINDYGRKSGALKEGEDNFTGDDVREGLTAVLSVKLREPQFEGQTKAKLGNPEARAAVETVFGAALTDFLEENPEDARIIISKITLALKARKAARAAKESILRKGVLEGLTLPGKLTDCQSKDASESELILVEGDSAGGTVKQGRDRRTQAVLPIKGKILNVERVSIDKMLAFKEIKALIIALGAAIAEELDINKLRYHKIIIATDADVDGAHITTLLLTLFFRYYQPVIEQGYLYIAQPPLFRIQKGKEIFYAYSDKEKNKIVNSKDGYNIQRYKGLGEMNAEQLWETTIDPARRSLKQVTIKDAAEASKVFETLMGSDVEARRLFIQSRAKAVQNLDI